MQKNKIVLVFEAKDPTQGVANMVLNVCPKGYEFISMKRIGKKVTAEYKRKGT